MHLMVSSKGMLLKWVVPVILVVALLGFFGLRAWGGSGGSSDLSDMELTDFNPAYQSDFVAPAEGASGPGGVYVLYSIEVAEQTNMFPAGTGVIATVTVTNNIAEPIANATSPVAVNHNGDIRGNIVVTADAFSMNMVPDEGVMTYSETDAAPDSISIATFPNIIIHPGKSVVFQVPVNAPLLSVGQFLNVKAEYVGATTNW